MRPKSSSQGQGPKSTWLRITQWVGGLIVKNPQGGRGRVGDFDGPPLAMGADGEPATMLKNPCKLDEMLAGITLKNFTLKNFTLRKFGGPSVYSWMRTGDETFLAGRGA